MEVLDEILQEQVRENIKKENRRPEEFMEAYQSKPLRKNLNQTGDTVFQRAAINKMPGLNSAPSVFERGITSKKKDSPSL